MDKTHSFVANTTSTFDSSCSLTNVSSCSVSCTWLPTENVSIVYCLLVKLTTSYKVILRCAISYILTLPNRQPTQKMTLSWDKWIKATQTETQMSPLDISDSMDTHSDSSPQWSQNQTLYFKYDCQCQDSTVLPKFLSIPLPEPMNPSYNNTVYYQVHKPTRPVATHLPHGALPGDWRRTWLKHVWWGPVLYYVVIKGSIMAFK